MPDGAFQPAQNETKNTVRLGDLQRGGRDAIGATVRDVLFRGENYAIYRSDRGVYVHFADDPDIRHDQRSAYVKLSVQICELRYLTSKMRPGLFRRLLGRFGRKGLLYDYNMAQALMLLMESVEQRRARQQAAADSTELQAVNIAQRAFEMALQRNTRDNTIRYVRTCVIFGFFWLSLAALIATATHDRPAASRLLDIMLLASATGIVGAVFSVIVRAQAFELRPCDDSGMNLMMSMIRVGMGGIAGPVLLLLMTTALANMGGVMETTQLLGEGGLRTVGLLGLISGFAERLVPTLVRGAADRMEKRAGTPGQAAVEAANAGAPTAGPTHERQSTNAVSATVGPTVGAHADI